MGADGYLNRLQPRHLAAHLAVIGDEYGLYLFYLTTEEVLAGATVHAAQALGLAKKGKIEVGCDADLVLWDIARPADLAYQMGLNPITGIMVQGRWRERYNKPL